MNSVMVIDTRDFNHVRNPFEFRLREAVERTALPLSVTVRNWSGHRLMSYCCRAKPSKKRDLVSGMVDEMYGVPGGAMVIVSEDCEHLNVKILADMDDKAIGRMVSRVKWGRE